MSAYYIKEIKLQLLAVTFHYIHTHSHYPHGSTLTQTVYRPLLENEPMYPTYQDIQTMRLLKLYLLIPKYLSWRCSDVTFAANYISAKDYNIIHGVMGLEQK